MALKNLKSRLSSAQNRLATLTGKSEADVLAIMQAETWYTAQEAVDAGFINSISASPKVKANWDLSAYANAPAPATEPVENLAAEDHRARQQQRLNMLSRLAIS